VITCGDNEVSPVLASFSTMASSDQSAGHFYWTYRFLHNKQAGLGRFLGQTIGPRNQRASFIFPYFRKQREKRFRLTFWDFFAYRVWALPALWRDLACRGTTHVQFYDGGIPEFLIGFFGARANPKMTFIYNFHWAVEWLDLLGRQSGVRLQFKKIFVALLEESPANLVLAAETPKFAKELGGVLGSKIAPYPVIAAFDAPAGPEWSARVLDLLVIPQRPSELAFTVKICELAARKNLRVGVFLKKSLRDSLEAAHPTFPQVANVLVSPPLPHVNYVELLLSTKLVVLPYDKPYFSWGSSGKFNEAIACGSFPFVPEGCAASSQSNLPSTLHEFPWDPEQALERLEQRLNEGFASSLRATTFRTLLDWLSKQTPRSLGAPQPGVSRRLIAFIGFAFALYPPVTQTIRKLRARCGRWVDTLAPGRRRPSS
jgi:hypothetical protein